MKSSSKTERNEIGLEMTIIMSVTNSVTTDILLLLHSQVPPTHFPFPHLRLSWETMVRIAFPVDSTFRLLQ